MRPDVLLHTLPTTQRLAPSRCLTQLHLAAEQGLEALALALVAAGTDTEAKNNHGETPLHLAAENGHEAVALALVKAGADVAAAADDGSTPRSVAQDHGNLAMFVAAEEEAQRLREERTIAFAMGLQERLGAASVVWVLEPELLRMVVELVYSSVGNVLEVEGEINSDSDSEVDAERKSDDEGGGGEEEMRVTTVSYTHLTLPTN